MTKIDWSGIDEKIGEGADYGIHLHSDFFSDLENYNGDKTLEKIVERLNKVGESFDVSAEDLKYAMNNKGEIMQISPGDIIQYEEPVRIFHRYLVLRIVKEDEKSIMCDCLVYTGNGYTTVPYIVWKHDSYQYTTIIEHIDISKLNLLKE